MNISSLSSYYEIDYGRYQTERTIALLCLGTTVLTMILCIVVFPCFLLLPNPLLLLRQAGKDDVAKCNAAVVFWRENQTITSEALAASIKWIYMVGLRLHLLEQARTTRVSAD